MVRFPLFGPHAAGSPASIPSRARTSAARARAIEWSFVLLAITSLLQLAIVVASGSVALLADTIHNIGDAVTAIPLWIAFVLARRKPSKAFPYGLGRVEDLAGVAIASFAGDVKGGGAQVFGNRLCMGLPSISLVTPPPGGRPAPIEHSLISISRLSLVACLRTCPALEVFLAGW
jgi:hypothetical protein